MDTSIIENQTIQERRVPKFYEYQTGKHRTMLTTAPREHRPKAGGALKGRSYRIKHAVMMGVSLDPF